MDCVKCKKEIPDGAIWCPWCGKKQTTEPMKRTKRANGAGCAIKTGKTWTLVVTIGTKPDGTPVRKWKRGFPTKTAALEYGDRLKYEPKTQRTLAQLYDAIQPHIDKLSKDKRSHYKTAWDRLNRIHGSDVAALSVADLQSVLDAAVASYYPAKDIRDLLSLIYARALTEELVSVNKARHLVLPDLEEKDTVPFTAEEVTAMWRDWEAGNAATGYFLIMCYTGMMPGEIRRLTVGMIDLERRRIVGAGLKTEKRKSAPIVLPQIILPVLEQLAAGRAPEDRLYAYGEEIFYRDFNEMKKRCGCRPIKELRPYSCRHTLATTLADSNVSAAIIKEIMRHAKITTTQRYMHPDAQQYAEKLDAVFELDSTG